MLRLQDRAPMIASDYARVEHAIHYIDEHARRQPRLEDVAAAVGLSEFHFQRLFQRWAGISPKRFLQVVTLADARRRLDSSRPLLEVSHEVGLSGPSRLHDLFVSVEKMTPGEYKQRAAGMTIRWGVHATPLGEALFAATSRGLCHVGFDGDVATLRARWPGAELMRDDRAVAGFAAALRARLRGEPGQPIGLVLKGTPLQLKVWEALVAIPPGHVATYADVAALAGAPAAVRAVGSAIGANPVAPLIPCHRVIRATGALGEYRWGAPRKRVLLALERAAAG
jgi:AraC family transcriptional regulator of adaptative response/methylated-DNA-[protein]-cysteine methyltransferase